MIKLIEAALAADYTASGASVNIINTNMTISGLIGKVATWIAVAAGVVAFFYLIISGFQYLTAGGNADQAKKGGQGILNAVIGLLIIALSWGLITGVASLLNGGATTVTPGS